MSGKRRLKKLKRKARVDRKTASQPAAVADEVDDMVFPRGPAMVELMREDPECREMMLLPNGVGFKFFDQRVWVTAPRRMEGNKCFLELLAEVFIDRCCGYERYHEVRRRDGHDAALKLFDGIDLDIEYYDEDPGFAFDDNLFDESE